MNRFILIIAAALLALPGCGAAKSASTQASLSPEELQTAQKIWQKMDEKNFSIDVDYMFSMRGEAKSVTGYFVSVKDGTLDSGLPYFGYARNIPLGGGKGLSFEEKIIDYKDGGLEKDSRTVVISVKNEEDAYVYTITVYANAYTDIHVRCDNRDAISFRGVFNLDED